MKRAIKNVLVFLACMTLVFTNISGVITQRAEAKAAEKPTSGVAIELLSEVTEFVAGEQITFRAEYTNDSEEALTGWNLIPEVVLSKDSKETVGGFAVTEGEKHTLTTDGILKDTLPAVEAGEKYTGEYTLIIDDNAAEAEDLKLRVVAAKGEQNADGEWQWTDALDIKTVDFSVIVDPETAEPAAEEQAAEPAAEKTAKAEEPAENTEPDEVTNDDQAAKAEEPAEAEEPAAVQQEEQPTLPALKAIRNLAKPRLGAAGDTHIVVFYDFNNTTELHRESVTEGSAVTPLTPPDENIPAGYRWDGKWYTDTACTVEFDFSTSITNNTYLYPGKVAISRVVFVTYGDRIPPVTVDTGSTVDLGDYTPTRRGYDFAGWYADENLTQPVSGVQTINGDTRFYAKWTPGYISFDPVRWVEDVDKEEFDAEASMGTWYAKVGSTIYVDSTYAADGSGTHKVMWKLGDETGPVLTDPANPASAVQLDDVYENYYVFNNGNADWNRIYGGTGNQNPPYKQSTVIDGSGATKVGFYYMRVRSDIVFTFDSTISGTAGSEQGSYLDMLKVKQDGALSGTNSATQSGNHNASGKTADGIEWEYTAGGTTSTLVLKDMKFGTNRFGQFVALWKEATFMPTSSTKSVRGWIFNGKVVQAYRTVGSNIATGVGRNYDVMDIPLCYVESKDGNTLIISAYETLPGQTPDFTTEDGTKNFTLLKSYTLDAGSRIDPGAATSTHSAGKNAAASKYVINPQVSIEFGLNVDSNGDLSFPTITEQGLPLVPFVNIDGASTNDLSIMKTFFDNTLDRENLDVQNDDIRRFNLFFYERVRYDLTFNLDYDADNNGKNEEYTYHDIMYNTNVGKEGGDYPNYDGKILTQMDGSVNFGQLITDRPGYVFKGWSLAKGGDILTDDDWENYTMPNHDVVMYANWEKQDFRVEFYEDKNATTPFETHWVGDGRNAPNPDTSGLTEIPERWVWNSDEVTGSRWEDFDFSVPMYAQYGVKEKDENGKDIWVIRIYGVKQGKYDLNITKKDSADDSLLKDAGFTLYKKSGSIWNDVGDEKKTDALGMTSFAGLEKNTVYKLSETTVPKGYSATESVYFKIDNDNNFSFCDENGTVTKSPEWIEGSYDADSSQLEMIIKNGKLYDLPSAGGIGTYLFTVMGAMMMALALMMRKRRII